MKTKEPAQHETYWAPGRQIEVPCFIVYNFFKQLIFHTQLLNQKEEII